MSDYVIKRGDNLTKIAKKYGTTVKELQKLNGLKGDLIIAGKSLKVPENAGTTIEHTESTPQDTEIQKKREAANQKQIEEMNAIKTQTATLEPAMIGKKELSRGKVQSDTIELVKAEMKKKGVPEGNSRYGSPEYWTKMVDEISSKYGFPKEVLIAQISREVTFKKNVKSGDQYGAMQIRNTAVRAMFPKAPGNWHDKYKELNEKLLNDILYKKDEKTGEFLKDSKGNMIPKYSSYQELLRDCKNDEVSLKVGALYDQMQYVEFIASKRFSRNQRYKHLSSIIAELKEKDYIDPKENKQNISGMATRFNKGNVPTNMKTPYAKEVTDSISGMNIDLTVPLVRRT